MSEFKNLPSGWKVVRLGDVFDFLKTYTNSRESLNDYDEISYIHYGEIHKKYKFYLDFRVASLPKIHQSKLGDKPEFIKNGDLVIADASEDYIDIAKSVEIKNLEHKAVAGLHTFLLRDKGDYFTDGYKGYILYEPWVAKELKKKATGISVLGISKSNLLNLKIKLPPLDEQKKIAEILSTWDEAINLTINLIESKKQFKKALMQNLLTAKICFPQFKDEWKETKLGEICDISAGTSKSRFIGDGKFYIVDMGSITQDGLLNLTKTTNLSQDFLDFGDLVMPKDDIGGGKIIGKVAVIDKDNTYVLSDHIFRIKTTENSNFLAYLINSDLINKKIRREVSGTAQLGLSKRTIENLKIKLPNLKEQQKIAEVLTACDDEINLLNLKLENLKKQKQDLMQKLLKGEMRTCYAKKAM
ncbi:restriction endonuclease subunit S [Campylobacter concisus]|uniref:restriction endonuclease subunit S n=1 Tax=Campylobacter concisus TaxID=199 RepID=UPI000398CAEB|nr:restriction endonuclease subunit S [Campylobacter concisus]ERJ27971.1 Type I restriction-modification system, specificity subunit S [Campylobacter concisus ATCC 51561]